MLHRLRLAARFGIGVAIDREESDPSLPPTIIGLSPL
jgi:hypothetical protein